MPQAGGPAAINGFLYQILHHLSWVSQVRLSGSLHRQTLTEALLVLEPKTGGDARVEAQGFFVVEQYKTRQEGTWSIAGLESVLIDLRKAVPASCPKEARYRFVTDGRPGRLTPLNEFLTRLRLVNTAEDLDDAQVWKLSSEVSMTDRQYFRRLVVVTRNARQDENASAPAVPVPPINAEEETLVLHLLTHFEVEYASRRGERAQEVEALLRGYTVNLGDERAVREHLVGLLMERLSQGESRLDVKAIDALLQRASVNPERLRNISNLAKSLSRLVEGRLARFKYQSDDDVRAEPAWPTAKAVLVIEGTSGIGKSWQLARLLKGLAARCQPAILVSGDGTAESILTRASRDVWQRALGETSDKTLVAVSHFLRELNYQQFWSSFVIAVDDLQDIDVARHLAREDWSGLGMQLVISTSRAVATALRLSDDDLVQLHEVSEFTTDELEAYLLRHGRAWSELPGDLKRLLRNPILAGLYIQLPYTSIERAPRSEYEIFERFWQRIGERGRVGDDGIVLTLGSRVLNGCEYPLPRAAWHSIGLESADVSRLEATGWLRILEGGSVELAHDRLLNWAIAKSIVTRYRGGDLTTAQLYEHLCEGRRAQQVSRTRLAYVPMDALWLLAAEGSQAQALTDVLVRMEGSDEFGPYGAALYRSLLPTLGARVVPLLLQRLERASEGAQADYIAALIASSFVALRRQEALDLIPVVQDLLLSASRIRQSVALAVLKDHPEARHLDRLWTLHVQRTRNRHDSTYESGTRDYEASFAALNSATSIGPRWLEQRIRAANPQNEPVSELAYLLNSMESDDAPRIWQEVGNLLMQKVTPENARGLLYCITRFKDRTKLDFVLRHVTSTTDIVAGAALGALSVLEPSLVIERLAEVSEAVRDLFRSHWLPMLLRLEPDRTRKRLLQLAKTDARGRRVIENVFAARVDDMGVELLEFVLNALEADLRQHLPVALSGEPMWLYGTLTTVGEVSAPELLALLESRAGGALEAMICEVAVSRLKNFSNTLDRILESARRVLILMGGERLTELVRRELESEQYWVRHSGLLWAFMRPDDQIVKLLTAIVSRTTPGLTAESGEDDPYLEYHLAVCALAHLGPDAQLLQALTASDETRVPVDLARLRVHRGPPSRKLIPQAVAALQDPQAEERARLMGLVIVWLCGDQDRIPLVRSTLAQAHPSGMVARYACIILQALGDTSQEFAAMAERLLRTDANHRVGVDALIALGPQGISLLTRWLNGLTSPLRSDTLDRVIRAIHSHTECRQTAIDVAVACGLDDIAGEAIDAGVRQAILDRAFSTIRPHDDNTVLAIEGLAKFNVLRAAQAIAEALQRTGERERQLCELTVRTITPKSAAAEILITRAVVLDRESLTRVVGQTLRLLEASYVEPFLLSHLQGGGRRERCIVAAVAGWIPSTALSGELGRLAEHDSAGDVRSAAFSALALHRKLSNVAANLARFQGASGHLQWTLLTSILETADPYVLSMSGDPLCLEKVLSQVPFIFTRHAEHVLHNHRRRVDLSV